MFDKIIEAIEKFEKAGVEPSKILVSLTGVERSVLNVLIAYEQAMNPNEIRNVLILDVVAYLLSLCGRGFKGYKLKYWRGEFHYPLNEKEVLKALGKNVQPTTQKQFEEDAKILKKYGIANIPDYRTIERILRELELMGVVISREEVGKAKRVYFINPLFLEKIKKA